jgi:hypothetical protein
MSAPMIWAADDLPTTSHELQERIDQRERARRRRDQLIRQSNATVRWSKKSKERDNRAAAKAAVRREVW